MEFLDISSPGTTYQYATKIEQNLKQKNQDFGSTNQKKLKGAPKPENQGHNHGMETQENMTNP